MRDNELKWYHIVYYKEATDYMANGGNYQAADPMGAYNQWLREYPGAVFVAMYIKERI